MKSIKAVLLAFLLGSVAFAQLPPTQHEVTVEKDQTITGKKTFSPGLNFGSILFSALMTTPPQTDGTTVFVRDASATTPCSGGGSGAFAQHIGGIWDCSGGGGSANFASPPPLGNVAPNTVDATTLTAVGDGLFFQPQSNCIFEGSDPTLHELEDVSGKLMWLYQGLGGPCTQILTYTPLPDGVNPSDKQVVAWDAASGAFTIQNQTTSLPTAAAQGQVLSATGAGSTYAAQTKNAIDPRDYGVDCSDTNDSTTAWAAAVTAAGNYGKIVVPQHCLFKLTGTPGFSLYKVYGLEIEFAGRQGNGCDNQGPNPSGIDYRQSYASGNTVVSILDSQRLLFKNLTIYTNGGADNGILIDQDLSTPPITTRNDFQNTCIYNNTASRNSSWKGISVSPVSASNVENIHFYHPDITCSQSGPLSSTSNGYGILFGGSANEKNEIVDDYNTHNCSQDVVALNGGDATFQFGLASNSYNNIGLGSFNDALYGFRSENATNAVSISNSIGPHLIYHNDFAGSAGTIIDCPSGCGQVTLFNNEADSTPANWFNVHGGGAGASGPLLAFGNRNFSWTPTDWQLGAFVVGNGKVTSTNPQLLLTPQQPSGNGLGGNVQSPAIDLQSLSGTSAVAEDYIIQTLPSGTLSNTPASSTLVLGHAKASAVAPWLAFPGTLSGLTFGQITNTANLAIVGAGTAGVTSYSYQVVAHGNTGTTTASNTVTIATGNATLSGPNLNILKVPMVGGCTYFDVYRTASGGTPSSTGKIGTLDCFSTSPPSVVNASVLIFNDNGLAGDSSSPPVVNTTGVLDASLSPYIFLPLSAGYVATAQGNIGYDTTAKNWHVWQNAADRLMAVINGAVTNNDCAKFVVSGSTVSLQDAGACGAGGGTTTNPLTVNNSNSGAASGTTFDGSVARTISTNTIGAPNLGTANTFGAFLQDFSASTIKLPFGAGFTTTANGNMGYDTTGLNWKLWQNGADRIAGVINGSTTNGDCSKFVVSGSTVSLQDSGAGCGPVSVSQLWLPSGTPNELPVSPTTQTGQGANTLGCIQFVPTSGITATKMSVAINTTSASTVNVGIYDNSLNLVRDSGSFGCGTGGGLALSNTVSSFTLTPGSTYYACVAFSDTTCAIQGLAPTAGYANIANKNATRNFTCANALSAGAMPSACGVQTPVLGKEYIILLEQ